MQRRTFIILLLIFTTLLLEHVSAQKYYVSSVGSDLVGDGSESNPWKSIGHAVESIPSTGGTIIVKDGVYKGRTVITRTFDNWVTIRAENSYRAKLTNFENGEDVFDIYTKGSAKINVSGFIITNAHPNYKCNSRETYYVVHFQDASDIIFENNIVYGNNAPGTCNELLKINRGNELMYPHNIHIKGNIFYDPADSPGSDMIDSVRAGELDIYENIFFSRNSPNSQSFITLKREVPAHNISSAYTPARNPRYRIHKNIFLNWDGRSDQAFIQFGEDENNEFMITNSVIENNLFIGNSYNLFSAPVQLKGAENITIRANTFVGNMPGSSYGFRIGTEGNNPQVHGFYIQNNIFSDPTGTMNRLGTVYGNVDVSTLTLSRNLFWNNNSPLPLDGAVNPGLDNTKIIADPLLPYPNQLVLPVFDETSFLFQSGSRTIRQEFERLVFEFATLNKSSPAIDAAQGPMPNEDILGNIRYSPDIGAFEYHVPIVSFDSFCSESDVLCVDDTPASWQEYSTIQSAVNRVQPGQTVFVFAGTYNEKVSVTTSGTQSRRIVIKAENWSTVVRGFSINGDFITLDGFNITSNGQFTGGISAQGRSITILRNYLHETRSTGISMSGTGGLIKENKLYKPQMGIVIAGDGVVVEGNVIERLYNYGVMGDCDYTRFFGDNHTLRNNLFFGTKFNEIGSAHVDCFQTFDNNGEHARNILVENNTCYDFHQGFMGESGRYKHSYNLTFRKNVFAGGGAWGICVHDIYNISVIGNTFVDIYYHGAGFRSGSTGNMVKNNIFYNMSSNYWASDGGNVTGDYNLLFNAGDTSRAAMHDIIGKDPQFVDYLARDLRPKNTSPACGNGEGGTDIGAFSCTNSSAIRRCVHPANINNDAFISTTELSAYMSIWQSGIATPSEVLQAIRKWKNCEN
ncbi:MAG: right-handed parallel beta-helix repeat-containing protein [Candidatus Woesearchaeota archaeon]